MSSVSPRAIVAMTWPVAGLMEVKVSPEAASTHWPPISRRFNDPSRNGWRVVVMSWLPGILDGAVSFAGQHEPARHFAVAQHGERFGGAMLVEAGDGGGWQLARIGERDHVAKVLDRAGKRALDRLGAKDQAGQRQRSEEHTSELQSLMRISYAVFCLKKK